MSAAAAAVDDDIICPDYILKHLEQVFFSNKSHNDDSVKCGAVALADVKEIKSAQQCVLILTLSSPYLKNMQNCNDNEDGDGDDDKNGSRKMKRERILLYKEALKNGSNRLVVRIWKKAARWWNLHSNVSLYSSSPPSLDDDDDDNDRMEEGEKEEDGVVYLARAEVAGYRISRWALQRQQQQREETFTMNMPQILFFSHEYRHHHSSYKNENEDKNEPIWALFSYVGNKSDYFSGNTNDDDDDSHLQTKTKSTKDYSHNNMLNHHNKKQQQQNQQRYYYDEAFIKSMIKTRHEYGYDEPHPRHGRVPVGQSLIYAQLVLRSVILPLHLHFFGLMMKSLDWDEQEVREEEGDLIYLLQDLVPLGKKAFYDDKVATTASTTTTTTTTTERTALYNSQAQKLKQFDPSLLIHNCNQTPSSTKMAKNHKKSSALQSAQVIADKTPCVRYHDMVKLYKYTTSQLLLAFDQQQKEKSVNGSSSSNDEATKTAHYQEYLKQTIDIIVKCIAALQKESDEIIKLSPSPPPAVLCHMDLQPQNLIFCQEELYGKKHVQQQHCGNNSNNVNAKRNDENGSKRINTPHISSVLDWEEAQYADPRFELLLLCRKVCANRDEANVIWNEYTLSVQEWCSSSSKKEDKCSSNTLKRDKIVVGDIEPWLKLEGVHAIMTYLVQAMDMAGGGRGNPWEKKRDLMGKIDRELNRLESMGWIFANREGREK